MYIPGRRRRQIADYVHGVRMFFFAKGHRSHGGESGLQYCQLSIIRRCCRPSLPRVRNYMKGVNWWVSQRSTQLSIKYSRLASFQLSPAIVHRRLFTHSVSHLPPNPIYREAKVKHILKTASQPTNIDTATVAHRMVEELEYFN